MVTFVLNNAWTFLKWTLILTVKNARKEHQHQKTITPRIMLWSFNCFSAHRLEKGAITVGGTSSRLFTIPTEVFARATLTFGPERSLSSSVMILSTWAEFKDEAFAVWFNSAPASWFVDAKPREFIKKNWMKGHINAFGYFLAGLMIRCLQM